MANEKQRRLRDQQRKKMNEQAVKAQGTMAEITDEAIDHLVDHYEPESNPFFAHDFVFFVSSNFFGHDRTNGQPCMATDSFMKGDMHRFSHVLADHMKHQPELAAVIFHAVEVYCGGQIGKICK
jgi:regulator of replication initiation timing